uniref:Rad60/SUMO-like domain-containing protein n=1 Tax=Terrapene triunguis TaxID=2587831 RepID=A0A674K0X0_9SAUR
MAAGEPQGGGELGAGPGPGELRLTVRGQEKDSQLTLNVPRVRGGCGGGGPHLGGHLRGEGPCHGAVRCCLQREGEVGVVTLRFFFDGQRLAGTRTPEQLGMEPDDVIEAWA